MLQLLPEVRDVFNDFSDGVKRYDIEPMEDRKHDEFEAIIKKVDDKADQIKDRIIRNSPTYLKEAVRDACYLKKNNDRTFAGYTGIVLGDANPEEFFDIIFALDVIDFSVTLVDDILDSAEKRGNRPAHHKKWGLETTIAVAMYLKSISSKMVIESSVNEKTRLRILKEMDEFHLKIYEGQFLDTSYKNQDIMEISEEAYLKMISLTTGCQFAGCFKIGGILADLGNNSVSILGEIGLRFGTAGQIRDDIIDYIWDEDFIWKTPLLDFKTNKKRIPLIIAYKNASEKERSNIVKLQKKSELEKDDYMQVLSIVMKPDNLKQMRMMIKTLEFDAIELAEKSYFSQEGMGLLKMLFTLVGGNS